LPARRSSRTRTPDLVDVAATAPSQPPGTIGFVLYGAVPAGTGDLAEVLDVVEAVRSLAVEALPGAATTAAVTVAGDPSTADHVERVHRAVQELGAGPVEPPNVPLMLVPEPEAGLVVDLAARQVSLAGAELLLTYLEYELLVFLAEYAGRVFSRAELLRHVWGYDAAVGVRTVDVLVKRIRSKLGGGAEVRIETVRGVGYRFVGERSLQRPPQVVDIR
jgi:hypothetical protein